MAHCDGFCSIRTVGLQKTENDMTRANYQKGLMSIYKEIDIKYGFKHSASTLRAVVISILRDREYLGYPESMWSALESKVFLDVLSISDAPIEDM